MLYFEPRHQETELKSGTIKLSFRYTLNDAPCKHGLYSLFFDSA